MITGWCKEGMLEKAFSAYVKMNTMGLAPKLFIYTALLTALYKQGKINEADMLLQKIVDINLLPDGKAGYCYTHTINTQKVANIFDENSERYTKLSNIMCNVIMAGLCKSFRIIDGKGYLSDLLRERFVLDNFTYYTLIHGFSASGNVDEAFEFRDEMLEKGLSPNIQTYYALVKGLCKSGNLVRALKLFQKLQLKGLRPNVVTFQYFD